MPSDPWSGQEWNDRKRKSSHFILVDEYMTYFHSDWSIRRMRIT